MGALWYDNALKGCAQGIFPFQYEVSISNRKKVMDKLKRKKTLNASSAKVRKLMQTFKSLT